MTTQNNSHTISLLVANKPGVLMRICLVFSRRGFNIESLVVSPALDGRFARMTITAGGDLDTLDQIIKQCAKLIDIVNVGKHLGDDSIEKELALIKVDASAENRTEILQLVEHFRAQTIDFNDDSLVIQVTGGTEKLDAMITMMKKFGIVELIRTGKVLMIRGKEET